MQEKTKMNLRTQEQFNIVYLIVVFPIIFVLSKYFACNLLSKQKPVFAKEAQMPPPL